MAGKQQSGKQGEVKDPEHDGRLKGHRGGEAQKAHQAEHGTRQQEQQAKGGSKGASGKAAEDRGPEQGRNQAGGSDDLKAREYRDADGNVHHHTKSYMEQHRDK